MNIGLPDGNFLKIKWVDREWEAFEVVLGAANDMSDILGKYEYDYIDCGNEGVLTGSDIVELKNILRKLRGVREACR